MTKTKNRWTLMNAKTGKLVKTLSFRTRDDARFVKSIRGGASKYNIFDTVTGQVVR